MFEVTCSLVPCGQAAMWRVERASDEQRMLACYEHLSVVANKMNGWGTHSRTINEFRITLVPRKVCDGGDER